MEESRKDKYRIIMVLFLTVVTLIYLVCIYKPYTFGHADPGWMMITTESLSSDFDLDLKNQLDGEPAQAEDQVSLGIRGEWYPLHEWLIAIIGAPFFILFGWDGLLLCNILLTIGVVWLTYEILSQFYDPKVLMVSCIITYATSILLYYSYSFSVDILGCFLFLATLYLISTKKFIAAGFLYSMTVLGRYYYILTGLALIYYVYEISKSSGSGFWVALSKLGFSFVPGLTLLLGANWYMYGSPLSLSYMNWHSYDSTIDQLIPRTHSFDKNYTEALWNMFISPRSSIWRTLPVLVIGVPLALRKSYQICPQLVRLFMIVFISFLVLELKYNNFPGEFGNRYFMSIFPFSTILMATTLQTHLKKAF